MSYKAKDINGIEKYADECTVNDKEKTFYCLGKDENDIVCNAPLTLCAVNVKNVNSSSPHPYFSNKDEFHKHIAGCNMSNSILCKIKYDVNNFCYEKFFDQITTKAHISHNSVIKKTYPSNCSPSNLPPKTLLLLYYICKANSLNFIVDPSSNLHVHDILSENRDVFMRQYGIYGNQIVEGISPWIFNKNIYFYYPFEVPTMPYKQLCVLSFDDDELFDKISEKVNRKSISAKCHTTAICVLGTWKKRRSQKYNFVNECLIYSTSQIAFPSAPV